MKTHIVKLTREYHISDAELETAIRLLKAQHPEILQYNDSDLAQVVLEGLTYGRVLHEMQQSTGACAAFASFEVTVQDKVEQKE